MSRKPQSQQHEFQGAVYCLNCEVSKLLQVARRPEDNQKQNTTDVKTEVLLTCSGSTWQNMDIFSFTDVSRGFEHLHTT